MFQYLTYFEYPVLEIPNVASFPVTTISINNNFFVNIGRRNNLGCVLRGIYESFSLSTPS